MVVKGSSEVMGDVGRRDNEDWVRFIGSRSRLRTLGFLRVPSVRCLEW